MDQLGQQEKVRPVLLELHQIFPAQLGQLELPGPLVPTLRFPGQLEPQVYKVIRAALLAPLDRKELTLRSPGQLELQVLALLAPLDRKELTLRSPGQLELPGPLVPTLRFPGQLEPQVYKAIRAALLVLLARLAQMEQMELRVRKAIRVALLVLPELHQLFRGQRAPLGLLEPPEPPEPLALKATMALGHSQMFLLLY
jgi:hypothetical protein